MSFLSRESEGSFEFGHYWREVDDLHDVVQHLHRENPKVIAIIGHSKGLLFTFLHAYIILQIRGGGKKHPYSFRLLVCTINFVFLLTNDKVIFGQQ